MIEASKLTSKAQTVIPKPIREALGLSPGDGIVYRQTLQGSVIERAPDAGDDDPFATFTEWAGPHDEAALGDL